MQERSIALIELSVFEKKARKLFSYKELSDLKDFLSKHPDQGDVIPGMGGIRKLRWAAGGKGKRSGARVIYFHYVSGLRLYLMTCYSKNEKEDITTDEKKQLLYTLEQLKNKGA